MKKLIFLFALVLSLGANAQSKSDRTESATLKIKSKDNVTTQYKYTSIKEFEDGSTKILDAMGRPTASDGECMVTVEISVTVTVSAAPNGVGGSISTTVTGSITTSCASVAAAAKKLRAQLVAIANG